MEAARVEFDSLAGKIVIHLKSGERVEPATALDKWIEDRARET
jgi:hypothetical protein